STTDPSIQATAHQVDLEAGELSSTNPLMAAFFDEVSQVKTAILAIKKIITEVGETHGKAITSVSEDEAADCSQLIDTLMSQIHAQSTTIRKKLKDMDTANKQFEAKKTSPSDSRIRSSQHAMLLKKFTDVMVEYNDIQTKYQGKYRQRLQKQFLIVKPDATAEEIEKAISGEGPGIFAQQIVPGAQYKEAKKVLEEIQGQRQDIMKIEKSILELQQLFVDMSVLISQQGDLINQIDDHVVKAVDYTNAGVEQMKGAVQTQKRTRKRMCILLFCLVILAIIIGVGVGVGVKK
ncbi:Syntaxin-1A, partial [Coelomomyces lativittatus]